VLLLPCFRLKGLVWSCVFCAAMTLVGMLSFQVHRMRLEEREHLPIREIVCRVRCERVFRVEDDGRFSALGVFVGLAPHLAELKGQHVYISLKGRKGGELEQGAEWKLQGILAPIPFSSDTQSFDGFLADSGVAFRLSRGSLLQVLSPASAYRRFCSDALDWCDSVVSRGIEQRRPRLARILKAMLLGQQSLLEKEQVQRYRESGTMHLFAISGQHVMLIGLVIQGLLRLCGLRSWWLALPTLVCLWLFVDITGASPSSLRAFLMFALVELSLEGWMQSNPLAALCGALLVECILEPLVLFSAGFQLSYGIVALLLLLSIPLAERLREGLNPLASLPAASWQFRHRAFEWVREWAIGSFSVTYAASVISLPAGVAFFGLLSHGGMLANLVMVPASSLVIFSGFLSLVFGLLHLGPLSLILNYASALVLQGMEWFLAWFVSLGGTHARAAFSFAWCGNIVLALLLLLCLAGYQRRWAGHWLFFALPGILVAGALLCFLRLA
jgi:competence protein ComEC